MVTERLLAPTRKNQHPSWEISSDGRVIGWIHQHKIGRSSVIFYKAIGIAPDGEHVDLENSADRAERLAVIRAFDLQPELWRGIHWHPRKPAHDD